ncbi:MAG: hypothetical protein II069_05835 [Oscillospiraceae bacterium]|nr:hypothetical protein [Oscillospiraceae bacterium]
MNKLFFGLLFIYLNINLNLDPGGHTLNLLPDWAGYCLLYSGLLDLAAESERFSRAKPWCLGMAVYTFVLWVLALFGPVDLGILDWALGLISTAISLYILYTLVVAIGDIETFRSVSIGQPKLMSAWKVMAIAYAAAYVLSILPFLAVICLIVSFVATIFFMVYFNNTRKAYNQLSQAQ